ncbi:TetR family transcriptional regulator [Nocardioides sp. KIGAM211]|uniref:TetR family transcriptional regulator n=1 Tax=Nocardioides luti TaxID=2761101 RepID=A0A7X0RFU8_9ACTN|nr:TetR/AcrR family transcriptional regulator [Nocardioides luti]MBB6627532.1 TetR family transcriptional regulator [Nocardioides luti]
MELDAVPESALGGASRLDVAGVRRRQIERATRDLIAAEGVGAVTIANIAKVIGTSRGVVNYHFATKADILQAALRSATKDASETTDKIVSASDDLGKVVDLVVNLASSGSDWWTIYIAFLAEALHDDGIAEMIRDSDDSFRSHLDASLGNDGRGAVVLALMKGLALQRVVDERFDVGSALGVASDLLASWTAKDQ